MIKITLATTVSSTSNTTNGTTGKSGESGPNALQPGQVGVSGSPGVDGTDAANAASVFGGCMYVSPSATVSILSSVFSGCSATAVGVVMEGMGDQVDLVEQEHPAIPAALPRVPMGRPEATEELAGAPVTAAPVGAEAAPSAGLYLTLVP